MVSKITADGDYSPEIKTFDPWKISFDQTRQHIKKQRHYFANKIPSSQSYGLYSSHIWVWELDSKESWVLKNWCFWTVVLEKTLESPLDCKEFQPVNPKVNQSWISFGSSDAEAETPIFRTPDVKNWLIGKDPDAGKNWQQHEKGTTEDEMIEWHHKLDGHEFEHVLSVGEGQGSLVCYSPCVCRIRRSWVVELNWIYVNRMIQYSFFYASSLNQIMLMFQIYVKLICIVVCSTD